MTNPVGRPRTGRTTRVVRVPEDMDVDMLTSFYYDVLPKLRLWKDKAELATTSPRYSALKAMFEDIGDI